MIAQDFRVFFMGHKGSMEAKYTTNKGILPEMLIREMRESFRCSEVLLDLESATESNSAPDKKQAIQDATPDELGQLLEMFQKLDIGKKMARAGNASLHTVI